MDKHRQLIAWQLCRELARDVYGATERFPAAERFGVTAQLRRAAVGAVANIAEGYARFGPAELTHFLSMALGSLAEVDALLQVAHDVGCLDASTFEQLSAVRGEASRVTLALQRRIRR